MPEMHEIKIASALAELMSGPEPLAQHRVIVRYRRDLTIAGRPLSGAGTVHFTLIPAAAMRASSAQIHALAASASVERIWPDMPVYTCLDLSVPLVRAPQVWEAGYSGRSVRVAVLDTGLDTGHPDFAGRVVALTDFTGEGVRDEHGHGTHVAGIAAGAGHTYRGVAPEADLYVAKVLHRDGSGYMSEVLAGLDWAVQQRAQVVNISLGGVGPCDGTDALSAACDAAVDHGVVVCVAAGNYGPGASTVGPPGCARKPLTVGACSKQDVIAPFSARGPTGDGRIKPDLLMPGVGVASCRAQGTTMGTPVDSLYTLSSGTSMAAPHATGAVALLLEAFPDSSAAELKQRLVDAAQDLGLDPNAQGGGRADAHRAFLGEDVSSPPSPARGGCVTSVLRRVISRP